MSGRPRCQGAHLACCLVLCGGCAFGPRALERSHGRYYEAVRRVDEEQLLRNLVHLRYNEAPDALNVTSIAAQYELTGQAEARPFFIAPNPSNSNIIFRTFTSILPDVQAGGSTRPTLTMVPADNSEEVHRFLTPASTETLVFLTQTTWPVSAILRLWAERLNGVPNAPTASGPQQDVPPDFARFRRVAELIQLASDREWAVLRSEERVTPVGAPLPADAVTAGAQVEAAKNGLEYVQGADPKTRLLVRRQRRMILDFRVGPESSPELAELFGLLNLDPARRVFDLSTGRGAPPDPLNFPRPPTDQIVLEPRSTAQVYFFMANGVEVPPEHISCGLVRPPAGPDGRVIDMREVTAGLFEVHVAGGHKPPASAYVAVPYRGYWYYVDDRDQASKSTLVLMLQLSKLDFRRGQPGGGAPQLTLPVGR
jgi:hypothetical protein